MIKHKPGAARLGLEALQEIELKPVTGNVATDGVVYSSVATFGTTAGAVYSYLFDPGLTLAIKELEPSLTTKFTGLNGSLVGSIMYYWTAQTENARIVGSGGTPGFVTGAEVNLNGTYQKAVGTLTTSEDTFSGYANIGSLPYTPLRIKLYAVGIQAAICTAVIKNSSKVRVIGVVPVGF